MFRVPRRSTSPHPIPPLESGQAIAGKLPQWVVLSFPDNLKTYDNPREQKATGHVAIWQPILRQSLKFRLA